MDINLLVHSEHSWFREQEIDVKRTIELDHLDAVEFAMVLMSVVEGVYLPVHEPLISLNLGIVPADGPWRSASVICVPGLYFSIRLLARFMFPLQLLSFTSSV